jgi:ribonucleoside-diphosphate reductase alpha chain
MSNKTKDRSVNILPLSLLNKEELVDPTFSQNALVVLKNRYLAKDENGKIVEDPKDMLIRVATVLADVETSTEKKKLWGKKFYEIMASREFIPNSPTLMNAGRSMGMLSACFVLPVEDNIQGIFGSISATALVQKAGGGTGFNFSNLRPKGSIVKSSGGTTSGPLSFVDVFSQATTAIQQGAFRRGANMGILRVDHPDIIEFIKAKEDLSRWQNYNVSILVPDEWMEVLITDPLRVHDVHHAEWGEGELWKRTDPETRELEIRAFSSEEPIGRGWEHWTIGDTWNLICERAWQTGEPGLFFADAADRRNTIKQPCGPIQSTNPCGEIPLHPYDSCNLGSIDLEKFYDEKINDINYDSLGDVVDIAVRFLDNVIDANNYPLPEIAQMSRDTTRRIGLGVMGWADLLFRMNFSYGSDDSLSLAKKIQAFITDRSAKASEEIGKEKGNFGAWETSSYGEINRPMRNSFHTTVAPTGTISIIADCSGGIEPLYALAFKREVMPDDSGMFEVMEEHNRSWKEAIQKSSLSDDTKKDLLKHAVENGSITDYESNDQNVLKLKEIFVTAHDIHPDKHVDMQIAWQKYIDSSISKTINLSKESKIDDVKRAYIRAYDGGCTGITVYRDGCRENVAGMKQPMKSLKKASKPSAPVAPTKPGPSNDVFPAYRTKIRTQFGNLHVIVVRDENNEKEIEIFAQLGKAGDLIAADIEAICRVSSKLLRCGGNLRDVIEQLEHIGSNHVMPSEHGKITSMPDALAKALKKYLNTSLDKSCSKAKDLTESEYGVACPSCGIKLTFQEGCKKCNSCGFSAC